MLPPVAMPLTTATPKLSPKVSSERSCSIFRRSGTIVIVPDSHGGSGGGSTARRGDSNGRPSRATACDKTRFTKTSVRTTPGSSNDSRTRVAHLREKREERGRFTEIGHLVFDIYFCDRATPDVDSMLPIQFLLTKPKASCCYALAGKLNPKPPHQCGGLL